MSALGRVDIRRAPDAVLVERRVSAHRGATSAEIAAMVHARCRHRPAGEPRRRWSIRGWPSACARSASKAFATTARWSPAPAGADERQRDAGGADHQRHPLLPRAAPFRPPEERRAAAAARIARARGGRVRIWSAACSTARSPIRSRLTVLSVMPDAADCDVRILATDIDPKIAGEGARRRLSTTPRSRPLPGDCASAGSRTPPPTAAASGRSTTARAGHLPRAEPDGDWPMRASSTSSSAATS